jgi:CheY-like chemotaxis protein
MSKTVLIVEKDLALMKSLREGLQERGFSVEETTDGKGAPELIRKKKPDAVVLAVDLDAGQNGYIICKKLKSDTDLKVVPVVIIGDPKGFESHQKLKTRAEDYVGKPFEVETLVTRVAGLVGFPELPLEDAYPSTSVQDGPPVEEISLESVHDGVPDPDFEMVDSMFEEKSAPLATDLLPPPFEEDIVISSGSGERELPSEKTVVNFLAPPPEARRTSTPPFQSSASGAMDPVEARELRARVTELTGALDEARSHASELDNRVRDLEAQLEAQQTDLETARAATSKGESKEVFALRDAANKKDKEILKLKNELNAKEQEIVELRDKENTLEQQASESSSELAKREAQLKTLQSKADQLLGERKRIEQQLTQSREESRVRSRRAARRARNAAPTTRRPAA